MEELIPNHPVTQWRNEPVARSPGTQGPVKVQRAAYVQGYECIIRE
jgi:hypothetical protein